MAKTKVAAKAAPKKTATKAAKTTTKPTVSAGLQFDEKNKIDLPEVKQLKKVTEPLKAEKPTRYTPSVGDLVNEKNHGSEVFEITKIHKDGSVDIKGGKTTLVFLSDKNITLAK